jgi:predicted NBD/HSP70 family sugar kinase
MANVVAFDVGGTKISATVFDENGDDLLGGEVLKVHTPLEAEPDEFVGLLADQIAEFSYGFGDIAGWGIAFPGPFKRHASGELIVMPNNIPKMRGTVLEAVMHERIPDLVGYVDNDLKLALWGERLAGAAYGFDNVIGFVHSTGVSTATIMDGEIVRGPDNNAGEVGCLRVEYDPGLACPCDAQFGEAHGHLEGQIRGPVLAELFFGVDRKDPKAVRMALESATSADRSNMIAYCVPYVVGVLAPMCQLASAERVVLHGGIADYLGTDYARALQERLRDASQTFAAADGQVVTASNVSGSPLIGAADLTFAKAGLKMGTEA